MSESQTDGITVAFTSSESADRLAEVLGATPPHDFHWVKVTVLPPRSDDVRTDSGLLADMAASDSQMIFSQTYQSPCNPAANDTSTCWIQEQYTSGEPGLTGRVSLKMTATEAIGTFDVTWEGDTDRFGPPTQWYKHGTIAGYHAELLQGALP